MGPRRRSRVRSGRARPGARRSAVGCRTGGADPDRRVEDVGETQLMKVWIDQDLCTGDGLCEEIAPAVFTLLDDGLAYVKEGADVKNEPGGSAGMAAVPADLEDAVVEASEECPGRVHLHRAELTPDLRTG